MKNLPTGLLSVILLLHSFGLSAINIREALKKKLIKADVRWKSADDQEGFSRRHGKNIQLMIKNLSQQNLNVEVPCGFMFTPEDDSKQNMIIVENMDFILSPGGQSVKYTHGYCCEAHDGGPSQNEIYKIKKPAGEKLIKLAEFIKDNKIEGYAVQRAVWSISDNNPLAGIHDVDSTKSRKLIQYAGMLKGASSADITDALKQSLNGGNKSYEKMINIEMEIEKDMFVWILIQDINNNTVHTAMTKQLVKKGVFKKDIGISSIDFGEGVYNVRVYTTDKPLLEKKFKLDV